MNLNHPKETDGTLKSPGEHSSWLGWTLALLAVPLLHVLTLPPFGCVLEKQGYREFDSLPVVLRYYFLPGLWVYQKSPARKPMTRYAVWWEQMWPVP